MSAQCCLMIADDSAVFREKIIARLQDRTRFGLANAVTAVARDTRDPEVRWRLEELGGATAADFTPMPPSLNPTAKKSRRRPLAVA